MRAEEDRGTAVEPSAVPDGLFQRLIESISAVTYVSRFGHADEAPIFVSPQCERVLGLPRTALMVDARARNDLLHPDDRQRIWDRATQLDATGGDWDEGYRLVLPDGSVRWVHDQAHIALATADRPALWFGVLTDLTRANEAEHALAESEARYRALVEQIPAVVYIDTCEERPVSLYVSPQTERISGYRPEEWLADPTLWPRVVHPDDRHLMKEDWPQHLDGADELTQEYRLIHRDGHVVWMRDAAKLIRAEDGTPLFWQGVALDITDHMLAQERLRDSQARYRALIEELPAYVYISTDHPDPRMTYVSPQTLEMMGYTSDEWVADQDLWLKATHPDDRASVEAAWESAVERRETFVSEYRAIRRDGREIWLRDVARLVLEADGERHFWQGLVQDITESKRAGDELRASEVRYRTLVERSPAVVYEVGLDDERRTLYVSPQVEALFGYSRQEWLDQPDIWTELLHPDDREIELAAHDLHNETGAPWRQEYRLIANDGRVIWVRDQAELISYGSARGSTWQGIMLDITALKELEEQLRLSNDELELRVIDRTTELAEANEMMTLEIGERLRAEDELRATQARYRQLVEEIPAVVYVWRLGESDERSAENYTSPQIERLLGFTVDEWNDTELWHQRIHPHDRDQIFAASARTAQTGTPFAEEYRLLAKDGHVVWVADHSTLLSRNRQGKPLLFQGVLLDITARKEAEALEEQFRELLDSSPVVTYVYESIPDEDPPVRFLHVSQQISELIGQSVQALLSDYGVWLRHIHPDDRQRVLREARRSRETGRPWQRTFRLIARDGRVVSVLSAGRCIQRDGDGTPRRFVGALIDVTASTIERDRLEMEREQLHSLVEGLPGFAWTEIVEGEPGKGRLTFVGARVEEVLGYTAEELLSAPGLFDKLVHPDDRDRVDALAVHHDLTEEPWLTEFRSRTRDGRTRWLRSQGLASHDENGRLVWNGITFDITDERTSEEDVTVVPDTTQVES